MTMPRRITKHVPFIAVSVAIASVVACESGSDDGNAGSPGTGGSDSGASQSDSSTSGGDATVVYLDAGLNQPSDGGDQDATPPSFDSGAPSCGYPVSCPTTRGFGMISGDTGSDSATTKGNTSEWLSVRVTENDNSAIGHALSITATLTSAPGTVYALYLYLNDGTALAECTQVAGQSTNSGVTNSAQISWGEGLVGNDKDDSATVTVRVQHISGPCDAIDPWSVVVTGNTK